MNKPGAVVGCMSCGALYSAGPGDEGLCSKCSADLAPELPARTPTSASPSRPSSPQSAPRPAAPQPISRITTPQSTARASPAPKMAPPPRTNTPRPGVVTALRPRFRRALNLGPLLKGAVVVALAGSAVAFVMPQRSRSEAWTQLQRGSFSGAWTSLRRHGLPGAWASAQRRASEAWVAVRSRIPLGDKPTRSTASATLAPQKRGQPAATNNKPSPKRGKHDLNAVSSTP
jgi:hypothetical protein